LQYHNNPDSDCGERISYSLNTPNISGVAEYTEYGWARLLVVANMAEAEAAEGAQSNRQVSGQVNGTETSPTSSYSAKFTLHPHFIGGNKLSNASTSKVKDFVAAHDGHTVITNVCLFF